MTATKNIKPTDELIRARIDHDLKNQFDVWCSTKRVSSSQIIRWIIEMHLEDPNQLWHWLSKKESLEEHRDEPV